MPSSQENRTFMRYNPTSSSFGAARAGGKFMNYNPTSSSLGASESGVTLIHRAKFVDDFGAETQRAAAQPLPPRATQRRHSCSRPSRRAGLEGPHLRLHLDAVVTVSEAQIAAGVRLAAEWSRLIAEPSGALVVAAMAFRAEEAGLMGLDGPVAGVLSGGNVDPEAYRRYLAAPLPS